MLKLTSCWEFSKGLYKLLSIISIFMSFVTMMHVFHSLEIFEFVAFNISKHTSSFISRFCFREKLKCCDHKHRANRGPAVRCQDKGPKLSQYIKEYRHLSILCKCISANYSNDSFTFNNSVQESPWQLHIQNHISFSCRTSACVS